MTRLVTILLVSLLEIIPSGQTFLRQLQPRDSILVADQIEYGVRIDGVAPGTVIGLPDIKSVANDTLVLVREWKLDSLAAGRRLRPKALRRWVGRGKPIALEASVVLAPFEEGTYHLPDLPAVKSTGERVDTLLFAGQEMEVKTMPVDTSTFEINDIKGQMVYPVTVGELVPYAAGILAAVLLTLFVVWFLRKKSSGGAAAASDDPAHIVALRELDKYRSDRYWAPERQKAFYSGVTDTLKTYIDARFGVDAPEMTTAELFDALKGEKELAPGLYAEVRELFERADFVKFAKYTASDEDNSKVLPVAVRFVTSTYQTEIDKEVAQ